MKLNEKLVFDAFVKEANEHDPDWDSGSVLIQAGVGPGYSWRCSTDIKRKDGTDSDAFSFFRKAEVHLEEYFSQALKNGQANEIEMLFQGKKLKSITPRWNQQIMDEYEAGLKEGEKGNVKPWYEDDEE